MISGGVDSYFHYLGMSQTKNAFNDLYTLMKANQGSAGAAGGNFHCGLKVYVYNAGYNLSKVKAVISVSCEKCYK